MSDLVGIKRSFSETESSIYCEYKTYFLSSLDLSFITSTSIIDGKEPAYFPLIEEPERNELEYISLTTHREQFGSVRIYSVQ